MRDCQERISDYTHLRIENGLLLKDLKRIQRVNQFWNKLAEASTKEIHPASESSNQKVDTVIHEDKSEDNFSIRLSPSKPAK